ncbi:hypothetical protein GCM10010112_67130 [Actinoplanes lobatus]|uniref:Cip1-like core domain-containing protein n=1 Tax=Actinoplanes lobatus TaxID=113568 RepID=A0A7W7HI44_9ACTN|nr:hypothetical protein [Actinoplanes lobatus]MBB4750959.1 hypothetical protein [Actinoplanes lobatus]GGN86034.1 hypothetical protein GCM10010112_67130 [Actinoplanes lobatus]GIE43532.1 hypothetical protein Alo02nite_64300 [Actinoplanes lobatus]
MRKLLAACAAALVAGIAAGSVPSSPAGATHRGSCTRDLLFCEDFDRLPSGGPNTLNWGVDTRNGTLTVERARHGKHLHIHTVDNGRAFLRVDDLTAPGTRFFGRMRLRVDAFPTAPDWAHFTLVEATGTGSPEVVRPIGGQYAPTVPGTFWGVGADGGPTGDWTEWRESAPVAEDTWQCFEWSLDRTDNRITVWIDGVANPDLTASTTDHGGNDVPFILPTVDTVKIGWQLYQPNTTPTEFNLWIDDIALSSNRLGC